MNSDIEAHLSLFTGNKINPWALFLNRDGVGTWNLSLRKHQGPLLLRIFHVKIHVG